MLGLTPGERRESTGYIQEDDDGSGIRQDKDRSSSYKCPEQGQKREKGCSPALGGSFLTSTERTGKGRAALALYWKSRGPPLFSPGYPLPLALDKDCVSEEPGTCSQQAETCCSLSPGFGMSDRDLCC